MKPYNLLLRLSGIAAHNRYSLPKSPQYKNHTDYEIEYEYTSDHDGIHFFNSILEKYGLKWVKNCPSKIARALND